MSFSQILRRGVPLPLVIALGAVWFWASWSDYRSMEVGEAEVNEEIILQYFDRELALRDAAARGNRYEKWLAGVDTGKEWLVGSEKRIQEHYSEMLGDDGELLLDLITIELGGQWEAEPWETDAEYRREMREWLLGGNGRSWDFELYLKVGEDSEVESFYQARNDLFLRRGVMVDGLSMGLLVGGFVACVLLFFTRHERVVGRASLLSRSWPISTIFGLFFAANLILYPWFYVLDVFYEIWILLFPWWVAFGAYDLAWRAFPSMFMLAVLLGNPLRLWRVFRLGRGVHVPFLLAGFSVGWVVDWVIFGLAPTAEMDPTDFLESADGDVTVFLLLLFSSVVVAPIFEELTFRGVLFEGLRRRLGVCASIVISSVLFAIIHTQYDIWGWISVGSMGVIAAILAWQTGSLVTSIALHALNNLTICIYVYFVYQV